MVATTESRNPASVGIDMKSTREIIGIINSEDMKVPEAVSTALDEIAYVTDLVVESFRKGGRLFYVGAGTSGRLGVLDASVSPYLRCRSLHGAGNHSRRPQGPDHFG